MTEEAPLGWSVTPQGLRREFAWKTFPEAVAFVVIISSLAEQANHHPDIDIRWNKVFLTLISHDVGKVTGRDRKLAEKINHIDHESIKKVIPKLFIDN